MVAPVGTRFAPSRKPGAIMVDSRFMLASDAFSAGDKIPVAHTCEGQNTPPPLKWCNAPEATQSFVLIVDDPDAPRGTFTHWILFDLPADVRALPAAHLGVAGTNDFHQTKYGGPCPSVGHGEHRYFFHLWALDVASLQLPDGAKRAEVERVMKPHVLSEASLMGRFARTKARD